MNPTNKGDDNGIVIDAVPEPGERPEPIRAREDTPAHEPAREHGPAESRFRHGWPWLLVTVTILVASVSGYNGWSNLHQRITLTDQALTANQHEQMALGRLVRKTDQELQARQGTLAEQEARLRETLDRYKKTTETQASAYQERVHRLADAQARADQQATELREAIAEVYRRVGGSSDQWLVAEAVYLTRLANQRLVLAHDIDTAVSALTQAEQRLIATHDAGWHEVLRLIAQDITELKTVDVPDYVMLTNRLDRLLAQLPLTRVNTTADLAQRHGMSTTANQRSTTEHGRNLKQLLSDVVSGFKNAVRIRRHDQPLQPLPNSAQEFFHNQNLQLQLMTAQLALMQHQATLYERSLNHAKEILDTLTAVGHGAARTMREEIDRLAAVSIAPPLPDIGATLQALEQRQKQRAAVPTTGRPGVAG